MERQIVYTHSLHKPTVSEKIDVLRSIVKDDEGKCRRKRTLATKTRSKGGAVRTF